MSIDTLAKEAARRAQGEIAVVEVPETEAVMSTRRAQHRNRTLAVSALVVVVAVLGIAAAVAAAGTSGGKKHTEIATHPKHAPAVLEFRPVLAQLPYGSRQIPKGAVSSDTCQNFPSEPRPACSTKLADTATARGPDIVGVAVRPGDTEYAVDVDLTPQAAARFDASSDSIGIVVDSPEGDYNIALRGTTLRITNHWTRAQAEAFAAKVSAARG